MIKLISRFGLFVFIFGLLCLLVSGNLFSKSPLVIVGQLLAVALGVWARLCFRKEQYSIYPEPADGPLVLTGPYRFIRHPMYTFALLLTWSSILGHLSHFTLLIGLIVSAVIAVRIETEEEFLLARYPEYEEYARKTKRIIPFII
jgi:protein-S-isoprenylcysteine O-methyltransferase Ste14